MTAFPTNIRHNNLLNTYIIFQLAKYLFCRMLTLEEAGWTVYGNPLYYKSKI